MHVARRLFLFGLDHETPHPQAPGAVAHVPDRDRHCAAADHSRHHLEAKRHRSAQPAYSAAARRDHRPALFLDFHHQPAGTSLVQQELSWCEPVSAVRALESCFNACAARLSFLVRAVDYHAPTSARLVDRLRRICGVDCRISVVWFARTRRHAHARCDQRRCSRRSRKYRRADPSRKVPLDCPFRAGLGGVASDLEPPDAKYFLDSADVGGAAGTLPADVYSLF